MAACTAHAYREEAEAAPAASAESTQWGRELMDEDEFIQDDDDASASCSEQQSEADSADVLEALIQAELSKFQQQQTDKYAARASEGQALVPLASPAPRQQQLRAQQKHQEALIDAASFEEQERIEYVPSTRTTLDPEQLQHVLPRTDSCSHLLQQPQSQQGQESPDPAQLRSEPEGVAACADTHIASAEPSSVAAADAAQAAGCSSSCAEAVVAAAAEAEPLQLHALAQPNGHRGPVHMECFLQDLSKLQRLRPSQGSITLQCSGSQEEPEAAAAGVCSAQDSTLLQESSPPTQWPLQECASDDAVECPELQQEQQLQQELSEGPLQQQQEACEWQDELEQQAQKDRQHGEEESLSHTPDAESEALGDEAAASPAAAGASERMPVLSDTWVSDAAEGFICQDDSQQSASPGSPLSSPESPAQVAAEGSSSQAAAACASSGACAAAAAAAFAAMSLGAAGAGELCPWEMYTADAAGCSSAQQPPMPSSCRQSNKDSSTRSSPRLCQQSPRQQRLPPQQQSPRVPPSPPRQSPRRQQPPQQQQQQQQQQPERRASAELSSPAPPQYAPRPRQHCQEARGAGPRPSSAPAGGSRRQLAVAMTGPAAAQLALRQASLQEPSGAQPADRMMPVVAESSQEGQCGCSGWGASKSHPSPGSPMQFYSGAAAAAGWTAAMHHQQRQAQEQYQHAILARMQQRQLQLQQPQQPSRPVSAGPWRSKSEPRAQRPPQLWLQQPGQRQVPAWDDSPMPLDIPGRVPIAQAVQLPSTTVASNAAYFRGWGTCSPGSSSILGGGRAAALAAASRAAAGSRPQTAGPVMVGRVNNPWESAQLLLQGGCSQQLKGCRTARSASSSPGRRRAALLPTLQAAAATAAAAASAAQREAAYGGEEAAGHSSMQVTSGCDGEDCSRLDELTVSPAEVANSSEIGTRAVAAAAPYLLGVLQQVRQANSYCMQLGLCTQYKLAEGSSRKDCWQLEQIQVELWTSIDPCGAGPCEVLGCGITSSTGGRSSGKCRWQRKKSLSLQQFTAHLNRLKRSVAPTAGVAAGLADAVRPRHSTYAAFPASRAAAAAGGGGVPNGAAAVQLSQSGQRLQSPDRARSRHLGGWQAAPVNGSLGGAGQAGSRVARGGSVSACQLLVLSPRGSSCGEQCLIRPASAPKSRSRLSPPRQEHV